MHIVTSSLKKQKKQKQKQKKRKNNQIKTKQQKCNVNQFLYALAVLKRHLFVPFKATQFLKGLGGLTSLPLLVRTWLSLPLGDACWLEGMTIGCVVLLD